MLAVAGVASAGEDTFIARAAPRRGAARGGDAPRRGGRAHRGRAPPLELFAEELREAQDALSSITGEFTADDLLGVIFSRFCIGK